MEKKISTFTPDEKEHMEKMARFEAGVQESLNEGENISEIQYYERIKLSDKYELNTNIYVCTVKNQDQTTTTTIYAIDSTHPIGYVNENGDVEFVDEFLKSLDLKLSLADLEKINMENLRVKSEELTPEELQEYLEGVKSGEKEDDEELEPEKEEVAEKAINDNVKEDGGVDLKISFYKEIRDDRLKLEFRELAGKNEIGLAYSQALGAFVLIETTNDGQYKMIDEVQPAKSTMKTVIDIPPDGEPIQRKTPHALMKTKRDDIEMSITIGQYGEIELDKVAVTPSNERVTRPIKFKDRTGQHDPEKHVIEATDTREENYEIARKFDENERAGFEAQSLDALIKEKAEEVGKTPEEFLEEYNKTEEGSTIEERMEVTSERIKEEKQREDDDDAKTPWGDAEGRGGRW